LGGRAGRQRLPGGIVDAVHPVALDDETQSGIHIVIGISAALPRQKIGGGEPGACGDVVGGLVREDHVRDVVAGEIRLEGRLILAEFVGPVAAGERVGMVVGMVEDVPPGGAERLEGRPGHVIVPPAVGPARHHRRTRLPSLGVQKRLGVVILRLAPVVEGQGIGPMVVVVDRGFRGGARAAGRPIHGGRDDTDTGRGEHGGAGGGVIGGSDTNTISRDGDGRASADVEYEGDLVAVDQGRHGRIIDREAIRLIGRVNRGKDSQKNGENASRRPAPTTPRRNRIVQDCSSLRVTRFNAR
jgi:hypothetical protein